MKTVDGLGFLDYLKKRILILDGATGTALQRHGMLPGVCPELYALQNPNALRDIQKRYMQAGSRALYTFTMGANSHKLKEFDLERDTRRINLELAAMTAGAAGGSAFVGGDISSTGSFIAPLGDLEFELAIDIYKEQVRALAEGGADFIIIETMIDIQEARAAVIAAKEACALPVVASMTFDAQGRTLTGTSPAAAAITLISAGADVIGLNCSTGPAEMVPLVAAMKEVASVPLLVKPNAGMPHIENGNTVFDLSCEAFRQFVRPLCAAGANLIGGCCGTNPEYIRAIAEEIKNLQPVPWKDALPAAVTSVSDEVYIGGSLRVIGERINPTGKPKLKEALKAGDYYEVLDMALEQRDRGAHMLDVNVGLPGVDESSAMKQAIETISLQVKLPLCIDSSRAEVIEQALRIYPGRAIVNSVSTKQKHIAKLLPVVKKYGAMFILLPIGENGIPGTAEERIAEIEAGVQTIEAAGLGKQDMLVDGLVMTVSSDPRAAIETLKVVRWCADNGLYTVLGISNSSFGLPERKYINSAYLVMAVANGLSAAIMNPAAELMMDICRAAEVLTARDDQFARYLKHFANTQITQEEADTVADAILTGKKKSIPALIEREMAAGAAPEQIINDMIVPALRKVGDLFEQRVYFLPQLIYSAEAAHVAFDYLEKHFPALSDSAQKRKS
jgi:Methionine synthase I (cobalamin-dependent), methyltransferase domain